MMPYTILLNRCSSLSSSSRHQLEEPSSQLHFGDSHASGAHEENEKWLRRALEQDQNQGQMTISTGSSWNHITICFSQLLLSLHHLLYILQQRDASRELREPSDSKQEGQTNKKGAESLNALWIWWRQWQAHCQFSCFRQWFRYCLHQIEASRVSWDKNHNYRNWESIPGTWILNRTPNHLSWYSHHEFPFNET